MLRRFLQGSSPVFLLSGRHQIRMVRFKVVIIFFILTGWGGSQLIQSTPPRVVVAQPTPVQAAEVKQSAPAQPVQTVTVTAAQPPQGTPGVALMTPRMRPTCSVSPNYSGAVSPVNLGVYGEGLAAIRENTSYYQLHADTANDAKKLISICGPQHEYAAQTNYSLNWSYALRADEAGLCRVVGAKVGVRTSMLLPNRQESGNESEQFAVSWRSIMAGLEAHELGHVALAEQYGARLLTSLQSYPAGDCYTMGPAVSVAANDVANQLKTAQMSYDTATSHGATQGAHW